MDFTREPIIESIITPREGFRIVVRSSKNVGHEEYFVDALEIVVFGGAVFFRSKEKPKPFLVPTCDYEIFEVREPRILLKTPSIEGTVKISSSKELPPRSAPKAVRPSTPEATPPLMTVPVPVPEEREDVERTMDESDVPSLAPFDAEAPASFSQEDESLPSSENQQEKKRDRRSRHRKRRGGREEKEDGRDGRKEESVTSETLPSSLPEGQEGFSAAQMRAELDRKEEVPQPVMRSLLPPPTTLIRDDIERLRKDETFKSAFFIKEDKGEEKENDDDDAPVVPQRLVFEEDDSSDTDSLDVYKATPAQSSMKEVREPFWIPPSPVPVSEVKKSE